MLNWTIDAHRLAEALEDMTRILFRIETVLTRLAPPIPDNPSPRRAELSDYRRTDPQTIQSIQNAYEHTAKTFNVELNSDKMFEYMREYEDRMELVLGEDSIHLIDELPWNKAAGGRIFRREAGKEEIEKEVKAASNQTS